MKYNIQIVNIEDNIKNETKDSKNNVRENDKIEISEDEIIEVKYNIGINEKETYVNNRSFVELEIIGKLISNLDDSEDELYAKNKKNIVSLVKWSECYLEKNDYKDVFVFINLGSNKKIDYKFKNMFVKDFSQEMSIEKGVGLFKLKLRQKFNQKEKIEVK